MDHVLQPRPGTWTVADIGGTHARLARWSSASGLEAPVRERNDDHAGPVELLEAWFGRQPEAFRGLLLALAMPVGGDTMTLTNRAWRFEPRSLVRDLHLDALVIINDFAAAAAGIDALAAHDLRPLNPGARVPAASTRLVLGPGTGLGAAAILAEDPPRIMASEAGHMTFGSAEPIAARLTADGCRRWGRVSWERVLCGDGLAWIDAIVRGASEPEAPAEVARRAQARESAALAAAGLFSRLLGEFAGDLCLAFQALEGVYLCGGVLNGLASAFDAQGFLASFTGKGRFSTQLAQVPCSLVVGHELGLEGAANYLAGRCRMPSVEWTA
jgi:glucokinase